MDNQNFLHISDWKKKTSTKMFPPFTSYLKKAKTSFILKKDPNDIKNPLLTNKK